MSYQCPRCRNFHQKRDRIFCSRVCAAAANNGLWPQDDGNNPARTRYEQFSRETWLKENNLSLPLTTHSTKMKYWNARLKWLRGDKPTKSWAEISFEAKRRIVIQDQHSKCGHCYLDTWMGQPLCLEVDHIDGNNSNNNRENLVAICPNCHSLTPTWRGRNKPCRKITDDQLIAALRSTVSIRKALESLGMAAKGGNYIRAKRLNEFVLRPLVNL